MPDVAEPHPRVSSTAALADVLVRVFADAAHISAFIRSSTATERLASSLPADSVSADDMAFAVARRLEEHALVTRELFAELARVRPFQRGVLARAAAACGVDVADIDGPVVAAAHDRSVWAWLGAGVLASAGLLLVLLGQRADEAPASDPPAADSAEEPIAIDPPSAGSLTLTVVSRTTGASWRASVSGQRSARQVARDLFLALHLKNDRDIGQIFVDERYELCQHRRCYEHEAVATVIDSSSPVTVAIISPPPRTTGAAHSPHRIPGEKTAPRPASVVREVEAARAEAHLYPSIECILDPTKCDQPPAVSLPEKHTVADLESVRSAAVNHCRSKSRGEEVVELKVAIQGPTGVVLDVSVENDGGNSPLTACCVEAIKAAEVTRVRKPITAAVLKLRFQVAP